MSSLTSGKMNGKRARVKMWDLVDLDLGRELN